MADDLVPGKTVAHINCTMAETGASYEGTEFDRQKQVFRGTIMKRFTHCVFPAIVVGICTITALRSAELIWDNSFSRGLRGWSLGRNAALKREQAMMYIRLIGPEKDGIADCKSPLMALDGAEHRYELSCTYRTDVKHSHLHGGAWFIFYKHNADNKLVGDWTGMILPPSDTWTSVTKTVRIPEGTKTFQTSIRVQGREGKTLDIRAVSLREIQ